MMTQIKVDESKNLSNRAKLNEKHGYFISLKVEDGETRSLTTNGERRKKGVYHQSMLVCVGDRARDPFKRKIHQEIEPSTQVSTWDSATRITVDVSTHQPFPLLQFETANAAGSA